jgi:ferredoxin
VKIIGKITPLNIKEKSRLAVPPHSLSNGLRLACQIRVENDLNVIKYDGFWGHEMPENED